MQRKQSNKDSFAHSLGTLSRLPLYIVRNTIIIRMGIESHTLSHALFKFIAKKLKDSIGDK